MKKFKRIIGTVLAMCLILVQSTVAFAATSIDDVTFEQSISDLSNKYGVEITINSKQRTDLSVEEQTAQLSELEARLIKNQKALKENNRQVEAKRQEILSSGRADDKVQISPNIITAALATYTVFYYQNIGSIYPGMSTIQCYITGNRIYSDYHQRYVWGSVVSNDSSLISGLADEWEETDSEVQLIDGGRTYYVQVWGDLTETYTVGFTEYEVVSKGWRIWYEAYCPA